MKLYDWYVRFLVWLGAAPPPGYEYLLPDEPDKNIPSPERVERVKPSIEADDDGMIPEENLPEWLKD